MICSGKEIQRTYSLFSFKLSTDMNTSIAFQLQYKEARLDENILTK